MIKIGDHKLSEANLQAEIYRELVNAGYTCELEVKLLDKIGRGKRSSSREKNCVIDIAVVYKGYYILFIEVKNDGNNGFWVYPNKEKNTKQLNRYLQYNIPLFRIGSSKLLFKDMAILMNKIEEIKNTNFQIR